jgi:hypothetical protein
MGRPASGDRHQQSPETVPIVKVRVIPFLSVAAEAVESAQSHVFLIGSAARQSLKLLPR